MITYTLLAILAIIMGYIRLAPSDPVKWHQMPEFSQDRNLPGGAERVVETGPGALEAFARIADSSPRTALLAGSVQTGMMTFVTRSKVFGFPDYTTVAQEGDTLRIYARLRFGRSDFGVNRERVDGWIAQLQAR